MSSIATISKLLKLKLAKDALVSTDSNLEVRLKPKIENDAVQEVTLSPVVELSIDKGNVFHPGAELIIIVPSSRNEEEKLMKACIGEDNLFEEKCSVILDLTNEEYDSSGDINIIGSYNKFSPLCRVKTSSIGDANIFESSCSVQYQDSSIGNGNVVAPLVHITDIDKSNLLAHETVLYNIGEIIGGTHLVPKKRNHTNGIKQNKEEVRILLKIAGKTLKEHHNIMEESC
mmetsp:Transcript_7824/g.7392  ORF Transcript_7824/g.7392 Transcript_7824/m.7392 type:complete len:230 (-) Transcript_7824:123-812(-)|eukprot:CAMPEP_0197829154 /NCGR_PEP_ID=MMETSP1437-20131217/5609_1 /TAXON_ID=49252 ORGANISM="Eucampia antarctica, Strain CCMP1452" /NCGR_SAMPLE_ID=MMETSP1437 /ASSEMBLY_ACC=CAM_ASM_001096 /LENGTH=229 /DNA_ID=CAMNT_0043430675 /DNA_START=148 /DNA_END=837 /DNA_ORIENTATION=-